MRQGKTEDLEDKFLQKFGLIDERSRFSRVELFINDCAAMYLETTAEFSVNFGVHQENLLRKRLHVTEALTG